MKLLFVLFFSYSLPALGGEFETRFQMKKPLPQDLFFEPQTDFEKNLYDTGVTHFWQQYGKSESIDKDKFKGYILFADPFHYGLKRISFLLGSDCSHFVHRIYQVFGANYPYAKTRHFIKLGESIVKGKNLDLVYKSSSQEKYPIDMESCEWKVFHQSFELIVSNENGLLSDLTFLREGDILVIDKKDGPKGRRGHMGIVWQKSPLKMLHSKGKKSGVLIDKPDLSEKRVYVFRWKGELAEIKSSLSLSELLEEKYKARPINCQAH